MGLLLASSTARPRKAPALAQLPRTQMWASPGPLALRWERPNLPRAFHSSLKNVTPQPGTRASPSPRILLGGETLRGWEALCPLLHLSSAGKISGK